MGFSNSHFVYPDHDCCEQITFRSLSAPLESGLHGVHWGNTKLILQPLHVDNRSRASKYQPMNNLRSSALYSLSILVLFYWCLTSFNNRNTKCPIFFPSLILFLTSKNHHCVLGYLVSLRVALRSDRNCCLLWCLT